MANRFIAVDSGKFATKTAEYIPGLKKTRSFSIRTKVSKGDFRDDALEDQTVLIEIDGVTYKVGNGARGEGASLDTNKATEFHKICTITALATLCSAKETDTVYVATGLPAKDWADVGKRMDYKDYILPEGEMTVRIKTRLTDEVQTKTFKIAKRYVFPESIGALFMDEVIPTIFPSSITGVIDIGNLNLNATLWEGTELLQDKSSTAELGGAILIQELSQEISTNITPCDEFITANILKRQKSDRHLPENMGLTSDQVEESKSLIKRVLLDHAEKIKRVIRARNWSLDVTNIVACGGTADLIRDELTEVLGSVTFLPETPYCNAYGYLRMMCARIPEINEIIPLNLKEGGSHE